MIIFPAASSSSSSSSARSAFSARPAAPAPGWGTSTGGSSWGGVELAGEDVLPGGASSLLLAEQNHEMRALLTFVLRRDGHQVVGATDGGELLEALAARWEVGPGSARPRDFDAIISAEDIPGIPGLAVLAGLRARGCATPFVLMTPDPLVQAHARRLGAVILDRPLSVRTIRRSLHQAAEVASLRTLRGSLAGGDRAHARDAADALRGCKMGAWPPPSIRDPSTRADSPSTGLPHEHSTVATRS